LSDPAGGVNISTDFIISGIAAVVAIIAAVITAWAALRAVSKQKEYELERDVGRLEGRGQAGRDDPSAFSLREDPSQFMRILGRMEEGIANIREDIREIRTRQDKDLDDRNDIRRVIAHINTDIDEIKSKFENLRRQVLAAIRKKP
jgi:hypothetical protein